MVAAEPFLFVQAHGSKGGGYGALRSPLFGDCGDERTLPLPSTNGQSPPLETVRNGARATLRARGFGRYTEHEKGLRVLCSATLLAPPTLFGQSLKMNSRK